MLRISNLAPLLTLSGIYAGRIFIFFLTGWLCPLQWTKTLQRFNQLASITLFPIPGSPLCPFTAFCSLQTFFPVRPQDPFLSYHSASSLYILIQGDHRRTLRSLVASLRLDPHLTFHSFRRSSASLAHAHGLSFHSIQQHGTWTSDALCAYLDSSARDPAVPLFFAQFFSS
jgi:hypothetical protein